MFFSLGIIFWLTASEKELASSSFYTSLSIWVVAVILVRQLIGTCNFSSKESDASSGIDFDMHMIP